MVWVSTTSGKSNTESHSEWKSLDVVKGCVTWYDTFESVNHNNKNHTKSQFTSVHYAQVLSRPNPNAFVNSAPLTFAHAKSHQNCGERGGVCSLFWHMIHKMQNSFRVLCDFTPKLCILQSPTEWYVLSEMQIPYTYSCAFNWKYVTTPIYFRADFHNHLKYSCFFMSTIFQRAPFLWEISE